MICARYECILSSFLGSTPSAATPVNRVTQQATQRAIQCLDAYSYMTSSDSSLPYSVPGNITQIDTHRRHGSLQRGREKAHSGGPRSPISLCYTIRTARGPVAADHHNEVLRVSCSNAAPSSHHGAVRELLSDRALHPPQQPAGSGATSATSTRPQAGGRSSGPGAWKQQQLPLQLAPEQPIAFCFIFDTTGLHGVQLELSAASCKHTPHQTLPAACCCCTPCLPQVQRKLQMDPSTQALIAGSGSGVLPENKAFTEQFLKLSGMAELRPPLKPAASGDDFVTIIPYQVCCQRAPQTPTAVPGCIAGTYSSATSCP
jgi:hypothetical protein